MDPYLDVHVCMQPLAAARQGVPTLCWRCWWAARISERHCSSSVAKGFHIRCGRWWAWHEGLRLQNFHRFMKEVVIGQGTRSVVLVILDIPSGASLKQLPHNRCGSAGSSVVQRGTTSPASAMDPCIRFQKQRHHGARCACRPCGDCCMECCLEACSVQCVHHSSLLKQPSNSVWVTKLRRQLQWRSAAGIHKVNVATCQLGQV
mmetsp:Transcript_396/g.1359  ORF Transcript_396/g.1359 Transcript_396/m.1359 type:complete len:204 (+) Transcript_396:322-933(+)